MRQYNRPITRPAIQARPVETIRLPPPRQQVRKDSRPVVITPTAKQTFRLPPPKPKKDEWIPARPYSDSTTFSFGLVLLAIIGIGIFFGMRKRATPI
jgi:hypothetical protein